MSDTQTDVLTIPPSIIVYGGRGAGKSTQMARAFPNCLWLVTNKDVLRPYASWLRDNAEAAAAQGLTMIPDNRIIELPIFEYNQAGDMVRISQLQRIPKMLHALAEKLKQPDCKIEGVIFDEWTVLINAVYEDICIKSGRNFAALDKLVEFHQHVCAWPQITKKVLGFVCQETGPKYFDKGPRTGEMQYKGGPAIPGGRTIGQVCTAARIVLQIQTIKDPVVPNAPLKRVFRTEADPLWERKFSDFSIKADESLDLREMLQRAGYRL